MTRNVRQRPNTPEPQPEVDERVTPRQREGPPAERVVHSEDVALHPWLQFEHETDRQDRIVLQARAAAHGYAPLRYLSWAPLRSLGLHDRVSRLCGPHWTNLFDISDDVSAILTLEFLSTLHVLASIPDTSYEGAITFRLGGEEHRLSLRQFAVHMGLYTYDQLDTPAFTEGISKYPQGLTPEGIWSELGFGPYRRPNRPNPKSTDFREPAFRIIHRAIVHGIAGRGDSSVGNVMQNDLLYLHCMVHHTPCQIAECLIRYLFQVRRQKHTQEVFGGGYVLRLATALGVEIPGPIQPGAPQFVATAKAIDMGVLQHMKMVRKEGSTYILVEDPRAQGDREAGPSGTAGDGGASISGADQEQTAPETTEAPPPPQTDTVQPSPPRQPEIGSESSFREIETMMALEFSHAEAYRSTIFRGLELLAASLAPGVTLPRPPVRPQPLTDFIRRHAPDPTPSTDSTPDPDQQPPQP